MRNGADPGAGSATVSRRSVNRLRSTRLAVREGGRSRDRHRAQDGGSLLPCAPSLRPAPAAEALRHGDLNHRRRRVPASRRSDPSTRPGPVACGRSGATQTSCGATNPALWMSFCACAQRLPGHIWHGLGQRAVAHVDRDVVAGGDPGAGRRVRRVDRARGLRGIHLGGRDGDLHGQRLRAARWRTRRSDPRSPEAAWCCRSCTATAPSGTCRAGTPSRSPPACT